MNPETPENPTPNNPAGDAAANPKLPKFAVPPMAFHEHHTNIRGSYPAAGKDFEIDDHPLIMVPDNCTLTDVERYMENPKRVRSHVIVRDLPSFLAYLEIYTEAGTKIFALPRPDGLTATAIIDYPPMSDSPRWGDHRLTLESAFSLEWVRWKAANKQRFTQKAFAEWIENEARFFRDPSAADMLTIATTFTRRQNVTWEGIVDLNTGDTALNFKSESKGGNGSIDVPDRFKIELPVFVNGQTYEITARFRHEITSDGKLELRYEIIQIEAILEHAVREQLATIASETGIAPYVGAAPERV